jgi:hypothetical protein
MDIAVEIKNIQKELEFVKDEHLINSIKSILAYAKKQKKEMHFAPFSMDEYQKRAELSEKDITSGRFLNVDDL